MLESYLEILLAIEEDGASLATIAEAAGLSESEALDALEQLSAGGFLVVRPAAGGMYSLSQSGKTLIRLGYDERFKRALAERLGGDIDSAS